MKQGISFGTILTRSELISILLFLILICEIGRVSAQQKSISVRKVSEKDSIRREVVNIGYGTQKKREVTSSITSVQSEEFNKGNINNPLQLIQGKVAGLDISKPGGDPNGSYYLRLRGLNTINANTLNSYRAIYEVPAYISSYNLPKTVANMRNPATGLLLKNTGGILTNKDVENASFVSLDNLSLGYNFSLPESSQFSKIRMYLAGNNLFYITRYKGPDPNPRYSDDNYGAYNSPLLPGIDRRNTWPRTRSVTFGANLVF